MKTFATPTSDLRRACSEVLAWLRGAGRESVFLEGVSEGLLLELHPRIAAHFLNWAQIAGFKLTLLAKGDLAEPRFAGSWQGGFNGFVALNGPDAPDRDEAKLLACAALLRDEFCRARLADPHPFSEAA
jgi:hypothetical protein